MQKSCTFIILAFCAATSFPSAPANLSGKWTVHSSIAGNDSEMECTFTQTGKDLTGTCKGQDKELKVTGKIEDSNISFKYDSDYNGTPLTANYTGTIDASGRMKGDVHVDPFGVNGEFNATSSKDFPAPQGDAPAYQVFVPDTVSTTAKVRLKALQDPNRDNYRPALGDDAGWRKYQAEVNAKIEPFVGPILKITGVSTNDLRLGGVPCIDVRPRGWIDNGKVVVYLHGGGYISGSARTGLATAAPFALLTGDRVIDVDYTLAPWSKWENTTDEVRAVLKALESQKYLPANIVLLGDSAGGGLAAGSVLKMRDHGEPMPGALILWSPWGDVTGSGDTYHTLKDSDPIISMLNATPEEYARVADQKNPYVSPVYGDFSKGFPPTLIQGGTKEVFLSDFVRLYQAIDQAGIPVKLDLYEGMPHVFQLVMYGTPEAALAQQKSKRFLEQFAGK